MNDPTGNPFRYTGRRLDAETGLTYYRARYYSSALGRFLQTDPIGYGDQMNLYAYVGNDPVNRWDPSGLECETVNEATVCTPDFGTDAFESLASQAVEVANIKLGAGEAERANLVTTVAGQGEEAISVAGNKDFFDQPDEGFAQGSVTLDNGDGTFESSPTNVAAPGGANPETGFMGGGAPGQMPDNGIAIVATPGAAGGKNAFTATIGGFTRTFQGTSNKTNLPVIVFEPGNRKTGRPPIVTIFEPKRR